MTRPTVLTPGNFDGVHLGHRALVAGACAEADRRAVDGARPRVVAMFFDPHPTAFFRPDQAPPLLTSPARRASLLRSLGADEVDVRRFDETFSSLSPEAFVDRVLIDELGVVSLVVGPDFRFGRKRAGDVALLGELAGRRGLGLEVVDGRLHDGAPISSTRIRDAVGKGQVELASDLLGRFHDTTGVVVEGDRRGRTIGFPTANLVELDGLVPADGVYAVVARADGTEARFGGMANIGVRPTVGAGRSVEVHLFDFAGDLYGVRLRVGFIGRLRDEVRFDGLEALVDQLHRDAEGARARVAEAPEERLRWI